jgi:phosphinothricin acetyltransferase
MDPVTVRTAEESDLSQITAIYNDYIRNTSITFDLEPMSLDQRREWMGHYASGGRHRLLVATRGATVLGYACSSRVRPKAAYLTSVETSIYCLAEETGKGIGKALYRGLFESLRGEDLHRAYACITLPNDPSVAFHKSFGFREVGVF